MPRRERNVYVNGKTLSLSVIVLLYGMCTIAQAQGPVITGCSNMTFIKRDDYAVSSENDGVYTNITLDECRNYCIAQHLSLPCYSFDYEQGATVNIRCMLSASTQHNATMVNDGMWDYYEYCGDCATLPSATNADLECWSDDTSWYVNVTCQSNYSYVSGALVQTLQCPCQTQIWDNMTEQCVSPETTAMPTTAMPTTVMETTAMPTTGQTTPLSTSTMTSTTMQNVAMTTIATTTAMITHDQTTTDSITIATTETTALLEIGNMSNLLATGYINAAIDIAETLLHQNTSQSNKESMIFEVISAIDNMLNASALNISQVDLMISFLNESFDSFMGNMNNITKFTSMNIVGDMAAAVGNIASSYDNVTDWNRIQVSLTDILLLGSQLPGAASDVGDIPTARLLYNNFTDIIDDVSKTMIKMIEVLGGTSIRLSNTNLEHVVTLADRPSLESTVFSLPSIQLQIASALITENGSSPESLIVQTTWLPINVFGSNGISGGPTSNVLRVQAYDDNWNPLTTDEQANNTMIKIEITDIGHQIDNTTNIKTKPCDERGRIIQYISLGILQENAMVTVELQSMWTSVFVDVYVKEDTYPTESNYDHYFHVPLTSSISNNESITGNSSNRIRLSDLNLGAVAYVGIVPEDNICSDSMDVADISYETEFREVHCYMLDQEAWVTDTDKCQIMQSSSQEKVVFTSNLFGSFGAGLFVAPNTIDFSTVFDDIENKITENAHVIATVFSILALYIILLPILRYLDKSDRKSWAYRTILSCDRQGQHQYRISVYTGRGKHSGTKANVFFLLCGVQGNSGVHILSDGTQQGFESGSINNFLLKLDNNLGDLSRLRVWHDNAGGIRTAGWLLSKMVIYDLTNCNRYVFVCEKWLAVDEDDGKVNRLLSVVKEADLKVIGASLPSQARNSFFEQHLWVSVLHRPNISKFTRVQRWSCCIALLFLAMIASALWYKTDEQAGPTQAVRFGPFEFTVHEIYVSVMTSLTVFIPNLLIITMFRQSKSKREKITKLKCGELPYWGIFIGYFLVVVCVIGCSFFTILFSFEWGGEKSREWLVTMILSTIESIFLLNPFKVLLLVFVYAFILRKAPDDAEYIEDDNTLSVEDSSFGSREVLRMQLEMQHFAVDEKFAEQKTVSDDSVKNIMKKKKIEERNVGLLKAVVWHSIFLVVLLCVSYSNLDPMSLSMTMQVKSMFQLSPPCSHVNHPTHRVWCWVNQTLLPATYPTQWYDGTPLDGLDLLHIADMSSIRIGRARLRQLRVKGPCRKPIPGYAVGYHCLGSYGRHSEDTTSYSPGWLDSPLDNRTVVTPAFLYQQPNGLSTWGYTGLLPGGGYEALFPSAMVEAADYINELYNYNWMDDHTRIIMAEFTLFNMNANLFACVKMLFEVPADGGVITTLHVSPIRLYNYTGAKAVFTLSIEVVCVVFLMVFTVKTVMEICRERSQYLRSVWNVVGIIQLMLAYLSISLYAARHVLTMRQVEDIHNKPDLFTSFDEVLLVGESFNFVFGLVVFITQLQYLRTLNFNRYMWLVGVTLRRAKTSMRTYAFIFLLCYVAFVQLAMLLFGKDSAFFSSFWSAFLYLATIIVGRVRLDEVEISSILSPVFFLVYYVVIVWVMTGILITLLLEAVVQARIEVRQRKNEADVVDYIWTNLQKLFPFFEDKQTGGTKNKVEPIQDDMVWKHVNAQKY